MRRIFPLILLFLFFAFHSIAVIKISNASGAWNTASTWTPSGVPALGDDVTIQAGHTVTLATTVSRCNNLAIDGVLEFNDLVAGRVLSVNGNTIISASGVFRVNSASNFTHTASFVGNLTNNGVFDFAIDANSQVNITFNSAGTQTISGSGSQFRVKSIVVNKGSALTNLITFSMSNFSSISPGWLTLQSGSVSFAFPDAVTSTVSTLSSFAIPLGSVVTMNSANSNLTFPTLLISGQVLMQQGVLNTNGVAIGYLGSSGSLSVNGGTFNTIGAITPEPNGSFTLNSGTVNCGFQMFLRGLATINGGVLNVGNASPRGLIHERGNLIINGGVTNIAGPYTAKVAAANFTMSAGAMNVCTLGNANTEATFLISIAGSTFTMSGGTITMVRKAISGNACINFSGLSSSTITGGEIVLGNASTPASSIMLIQSPVAIPSITVNSSNVDVRPSINTLNVTGNISINSGILNANSLGISLTGNWTHSGGTFTPGTTTTVTFNGTGQSLGSSLGTETFNHVLFSNGGTKTLTSAITTQNLTLNAGVTLDVSASNFSINTLGNWVSNGTLNPRSGTVTFNGTAAQTLSGSGNDFFGLTINNSAGVGVTSGSFRITDVLTSSNGTFANTGGTITLESDATKTARIAPVTGTGAFSGNFILQRFISGRPAGYHDLGTCVTSSTLFDWDDEMFISGINGCDCPAGISGYDGFAGSFFSVTRYREQAADYWAVKSDTVLSPGVGFNLYFGDNAPGSGSTWAAKTLDARGTPFRGNLTVNVTNTGDGFNLIANPYASAITFGSLTRTNVSSTFFMYDNGGNFLSFGLTTVIPPHQGFYVFANSNGSVQFSETAKSTSTSSNFNRVAEEFDFQLRLTSLGNELYHRINIEFDRSSTNGFDLGLDLPYLKSPNKEASSIVFNVDGAKEIVLNRIPQQNEVIIPLRTKIRVSGTFTLDCSGYRVFQEYKTVALYDKLLNKFLDMKSLGSYQFEASMGESPDRFILVLSNEEFVKEKFEKLLPLDFDAINNVEIDNTLDGVMLRFDLDKKTQVSVTIHSLLGQTIDSFNLDAYNENILISKPHYERGFYFMNIDLDGKVISKKVVLGN